MSERRKVVLEVVALYLLTLIAIRGVVEGSATGAPLRDAVRCGRPDE